jgi:hypothetical protein
MPCIQWHLDIRILESTSPKKVLDEALAGIGRHWQPMEVPEVDTQCYPQNDDRQSASNASSASQICDWSSVLGQDRKYLAAATTTVVFGGPSTVPVQVS